MKHPHFRCIQDLILELDSWIDGDMATLSEVSLPPGMIPVSAPMLRLRIKQFEEARQALLGCPNARILMQCCKGYEERAGS